VSRSLCGSIRRFRINRTVIVALPASVMGRVALAAALGLVVGPVPRLWAQAPADHELDAVPCRALSTVRAELIRFPDGMINVSVLLPSIESVPPPLWRRMAHSGEVSLLMEGSPRTNESNKAAVNRRIGSGAVRLAGHSSDLEPVGIRITKEGAVRLAWYRRTEREALAILADAKGRQEWLAIRMLIPDFWTSKTWEGLRASLHRAGMTHLQVLSGDP